MVSFKSPADTPAKPGMLRKSAAFVLRYQKFESISLERRVRCEPDLGRGAALPMRLPPRGFVRVTG